MTPRDQGNCPSENGLQSPDDSGNAEKVLTSESADCRPVSDIPGPFTADELRAIDIPALRDLAKLCDAYLAAADRTDLAAGQAADLSWAICLTLVSGPQELGATDGITAGVDRARGLLADPSAQGVDEAEVCGLWLSCAAGPPPEDARDRFTALASADLWEPVAALAWRALAFFGARRELSVGIQNGATPSPYQADCLLDASLPANAASNGEQPFDEPGRELLSTETVGNWQALLAQECSLAYGSSDHVSEHQLTRLSDTAPDNLPRTYDEAVGLRIAVRAVAALVRYRVGVGRGDEGLLSGPVAEHLPAWEREYLRGLVWWRIGDLDASEAALRQSLEYNPHQTCTRLALASLPNDGSVVDALALLAEAEKTREVCQARAALLARLRHYDEAEASLEQANRQDCLREPARFTWSQAAAARRFRATALQGALAERRNDWVKADNAWRWASKIEGKAPWGASRKLLSATRELDAAPPGCRSRRLARIRRERDRMRHKLGARPLIGSHAFCCGLAAMTDAPEQSRRDLTSLLNQRSWIQAEQRVGGGRLLPLGDSLIRLGCLQDAARAYEHALKAGESTAKVRLALLGLCEPTHASDSPDGMVRQSESLAEHLPDSPWPFVLAAVNLLTSGQGESVGYLVDKASEAGVSAALRQSLLATAQVIEGKPCCTPEHVLRALRLSPRTTAVLRLLLGEGELPERLQAFALTLGEDWVSHCPLEVQTVAGNHIGRLCDEGNWMEAERFLAGLAGSGSDIAEDLRGFVEIRKALAAALRGELSEAENTLVEFRSGTRQQHEW